MSAPAFRRLTVEDVGAYRAIRLAALQEDPSAFGSAYEAEADWPLAQFRRHLESMAVFAAVIGGRLVGTAAFAPEASLKGRHKAYLRGVYVAPEARGLGLGRALVQAVIDHAGPRVEQLILSVTAGNGAALALYESLGFAVYGVEPRALRIGDAYWDDIQMIRFAPGRSEGSG